MVQPVSPLLPNQPLSPLARLALDRARSRDSGIPGTPNLPISGGMGDASMAGGIGSDAFGSPGLPAGFAPPPAPSLGFLDRANLPLLQAGLSLIDPALGNQLSQMVAGRQQAQMDAFKMQLLQRAEERKQQEFLVEQQAGARSRAASEEISDFIDRVRQTGEQTGNSAIINYADALEQAQNAAIASGKDTALQTGLSRLTEIRNEGGLVATTQQILTMLGEGPTKTPAQKTSERQARTAERSASLAERKFTAEEKARGATVVGNAIVDLSDPDKPRIKLRVRPARSDKEMFDQENTLRDEFNSQSKKFVIVRDSFERIKGFVAEPPAGVQDLGAADIGLVFSFMKMVEPESSVREGEFATAEQTGGLPQSLVARYNKLISGERLTPAQRQDFFRQAEGIFAAQSGFQSQLVQDYTDLATRNNLNPENVVRDLTRSKSPRDMTNEELLRELGLR